MIINENMLETCVNVCIFCLKIFKCIICFYIVKFGYMKKFIYQQLIINSQTKMISNKAYDMNV
jgi:hypothetical protein